MKRTVKGKVRVRKKTLITVRVMRRHQTMSKLDPQESKSDTYCHGTLRSAKVAISLNCLIVYVLQTVF